MEPATEIVPVPIMFYDAERVGFEIMVWPGDRIRLISEFVAFKTYHEDRKHIAIGEHAVKLTKTGGNWAWEWRWFAIPYDDVAYIL